jgi:proteasome lid subunit RPN8/RPN11
MSVSSDIKRHAAKEYPRECCGLVVGGKYYPSENTAEDPTKSFRIPAAFFADCEELGAIEAVVHSHPDQLATPSIVDKHISELLGIPYWIQSVREGKCEGRIVKYVPSGWKAPLIGREFVHGIFDCLSIVLDYYKRERGIDLGTYHREDGWWNMPGKDYYRELLPRAGFHQVDTPKDGDVILMQIRSRVPNHAAIFLEHGRLGSEPEHYPAPGSILHHMYGRDSRRDIYGGQWADKTVSIWRYGKP